MLSVNCAVLLLLSGIDTYRITHSISLMVLWLLLMITFDWGSLTVVGIDLIQTCCSSPWNFQPKNLSTLLCITLADHGYRASQQFENCWAIFAFLLFSILFVLSTFVTGSITVNSLNVNGILLKMIYHLPIRCTAASLHCTTWAFHAPICA